MASFGKYKSVNNLPHFAAAVAEHGPYDPELKVIIRRSADNRYTIDGLDAFDKSGKVKYGLNLKPFINNTIPGVYYTSNGLILVDANDSSNALYISDAGGQTLPYSIVTTYKEVPGNYYVTEIELPSDHPFLQAYFTV